jgi:RNA polymerase sigma factor (sigma-70 family)
MARERHGLTLQTTALVNEVYLRLVDVDAVNWQDRARSRKYQKGGGGAVQVSFDEALVVAPEKTADILALDEALTQFAALYPRQGQVVELRFFGGLEVEEAAEALKVSPETIKRDWRFAKTWLLRAMSGEKGDGCSDEY